MARGGVYDQLAGGFHRYSVDERWVVPHFEKMLYDNTELLRNYVHGFQSFVREDFLDYRARDCGWLDATMTDREHGGFYASQDADVGLDDDGDYFTWTSTKRAPFSTWRAGICGEVLGHWRTGRHAPQPGQECAALEATRSPSRRPEIRSDPSEDLASAARLGAGKLLAAREQRTAPFIDRTLYTSWNAMAVTAYLEAARVLRDDKAREFALLTLNRLLDEAWAGAATLKHVIAYPDGPRHTKALRLRSTITHSP